MGHRCGHVGFASEASQMLLISGDEANIDYYNEQLGSILQVSHHMQVLPKCVHHAVCCRAFHTVTAMELTYLTLLTGLAHCIMLTHHALG